MFVLLEFSHFFIDKLYSKDEKLLPKIPELLFLNKEEDFVENYKLKKIKSVLRKQTY